MLAVAALEEYVAQPQAKWHFVSSFKILHFFCLSFKLTMTISLVWLFAAFRPPVKWKENEKGFFISK